MENYVLTQDSVLVMTSSPGMETSMARLFNINGSLKQASVRASPCGMFVPSLNTASLTHCLSNIFKCNTDIECSAIIEHAVFTCAEIE